MLIYLSTLYATISLLFFFFFNDTATTEIYTLSLHDALPISFGRRGHRPDHARSLSACGQKRSEEHTSELQSLAYLVCRLLLEKKNSNSLSSSSCSLSCAICSIKNWLFGLSSLNARTTFFFF